MKTSNFLAAFFASLAIAAPSTSKTGPYQDLSQWSPQLAEFYATVDRHVRTARNSPNGAGAAPTCDLSDAVMPVAPTPLPPPNATLTLQHVAVGRGVQNYTCADSTNSSIPVSIGAMANLYNASTVAACYPDILSLLPGLALDIPYPSAQSLPPSQIGMSGFHFFATNTTPVFNLDNNPNPVQQLGVAVGKKNANSTAPATSIKGVNGAGFGSVAWLKIITTNATVGNIRNAYRLNTAGGSPPPTCLGMPPTFSVQYAAEYWFWGV